MELLTDAEEAAERHDRVDRPAALLLDRQVVDVAEPGAGAIVHRRAGDAARQDKRMTGGVSRAFLCHLVHGGSLLSTEGNTWANARRRYWLRNCRECHSALAARRFKTHRPPVECRSDD